jgi:hypothetical protein
MKKTLLIIKSIFIIFFFNSYVFAGVSTPTPSTAINKIASSMSHSAKNNAQTNSNVSSATSSLLNSSQLTAGIKATAAKFGLSIDTEAATILAGVDTSSSASISKAMAQLDSNIRGLGYDYVPTLDQDTIVYETEWFALKKVGTQAGANPSTMTNFDYATTHDVFTEGVDQMAKGKVYVNFKKGEMWADMELKLTLVEETNNAAANTQQAISYTSGTAGFDDVPVVADEARRISQTFGVTGTGFDQPASGEHNTMKASATALQASCCTGSWWDSAENRASEYNHDNDGGNQDAWESVYMYGKFTTPSEGGTALGEIAVEAGHHDDNSDQAGFVASIERHEASGSITGKAYEGD